MRPSFGGVLLLVVVIGFACTPEPHAPTVTPTAIVTPTISAAVEEALEERFWMSVDLVGENSGMSFDINRTLDFELAKEMVRLYLTVLMESRIEDIEARGMTPFETVPFCLELALASANLLALSRASSPWEAAIHVERASMVLRTTETSLAEMDVRHNKQFCDRWAADVFEELGLSSAQGR
jgi:hypothetical protein